MKTIPTTESTKKTTTMPRKRSNSVTITAQGHIDATKNTANIIDEIDKDKEPNKATVGSLSMSFSTPIIIQSSNNVPSTQDTEIDVQSGYGFHEYVRLKRENRTLKLQVRIKS